MLALHRINFKCIAEIESNTHNNKCREGSGQGLPIAVDKQLIDLPRPAPPPATQQVIIGINKDRDSNNMGDYQVLASSWDDFYGEFLYFFLG